MDTAITTRKDHSHTKTSFGTLKMEGEDFVVMKREYLNELFILAKSVAIGEGLLREKKTRSFRDFLKSFSKRHK